MMTMPTGNFTIAEAAEKWIEALNEAPGTEEQRLAMIAEIRNAVPKTIGMRYGVGNYPIKATDKTSFATARNAIGTVIAANRQSGAK